MTSPSVTPPVVPRTIREVIGKGLTAADYHDLQARWIDRASADSALLRRVDNLDGRDQIGERRRNCAGILIPYRWPGAENIHSVRIRRDSPEFSGGKPDAKYLGAAGEGTRLYLVPDTDPSSLAAVDLPIIFTEGEFKAIAVARLARFNTIAPRFLALAIPGCWNWRGRIGKVTDAKGCRVDEKGPIPDLDRISWTGRRVIVALDSDAMSNSSVRAARFQLSQELRSRGAIVGFLEWDPANGKGIDDWLAVKGPDLVLKAIGEVDFNRITGWKAKLRTTDKGKPLADLANADKALRFAPEWEAVLGFDQFRQKVRILAAAPIGDGPIPRDWTNVDDTNTAIWMQENGIGVGIETAGKAVQAVAVENSFNPVKNFLASLKWDGVNRLDSWISEYMGAVPSNYVSAVGARWLISAVARALAPGCQVDSMIVFEGPQGCGKSSALRILAGEYFRDSLPDIHSKDASLQLFGAWIIEWSELDGMGRKERESVKQFISRRVESLRRPYGHHTEDVPRGCVFAGTTNNAHYLIDETGNRRFWPVKVRAVDVDRLATAREQLWAEAVHRFRLGEKWHLDLPDLVSAAAAETDRRLMTDPWLEPISIYVADLRRVTAEAVLVYLKIDVSRQGQTEKNRVGRCLRALCFEAAEWRDGHRRVRGYRLVD